MSLRSPVAYTIPEETIRVAGALFPNGTLSMHMAKEFGLLYTTPQFATLFSATEQSALDPARLALVLLMQCTEARRLTQKLAFHDTQSTAVGSGTLWVSVEIEWSVLVRQCLDQRLPDQNTVQQAVSAWVERRNTYRATVDWRFTVQDARTKLVDLDPPQS